MTWSVVFVCRHQDDLERDLADLNKQHGYLVAAHEAAITERDCIKAEVSEYMGHPPITHTYTLPTIN